MGPALTPPALVLCGGLGTRLSMGEKPLVRVCGDPMLDRVVDALSASRVSRTYAVTSPATPDTRERAEELGIDCIDAPGDGYVADLQYALARVPDPVLTVVADLPFLASEHVDHALSAAVSASEPTPEADAGAGVPSLTVCVPVALKHELGVSVDTQFDHEGQAVSPTGLNVVGDTGTEIISTVADERLAMNVNRPSDLEVAESRCV